MDGGQNYRAVNFAMQLCSLYLIEEKKRSPIVEVGGGSFMFVGQFLSFYGCRFLRPNAFISYISSHQIACILFIVFYALQSYFII